MRNFKNPPSFPLLCGRHKCMVPTSIQSCYFIQFFQIISYCFQGAKRKSKVKMKNYNQNIWFLGVIFYWAQKNFHLLFFYLKHLKCFADTSKIGFYDFFISTHSGNLFPMKRVSFGQPRYFIPVNFKKWDRATAKFSSFKVESILPCSINFYISQFPNVST